MFMREGLRDDELDSAHAHIAEKDFDEEHKSLLKTMAYRDLKDQTYQNNAYAHE